MSEMTWGFEKEFAEERFLIKTAFAFSILEVIMSWCRSQAFDNDVLRTVLEG
jgi:hypothetical protein